MQKPSQTQQQNTTGRGVLKSIYYSRYVYRIHHGVRLTTSRQRCRLPLLWDEADTCVSKNLLIHLEQAEFRPLQFNQPIADLDVTDVVCFERSASGVVGGGLNDGFTNDDKIGGGNFDQVEYTSEVVSTDNNNRGRTLLCFQIICTPRKRFTPASHSAPTCCLDPSLGPSHCTLLLPTRCRIMFRLPQEPEEARQPPYVPRLPIGCPQPRPWNFAWK